MRYIFILKTLFVALLIISCTYSPDDFYFKNIVKTDPVVKVSLNDFNEQDTIYIYKETEFNYAIDLGNDNIKQIRVLIDNAELNSSNSSFRIDKYNFLKTGTFTLTIQIVSAANTGSLAAKAGKEEVTTWHKWILKIDVDAPPKPELTFIAENGYLNIKWAPFLKGSFANYTLHASVSGRSRTIVITDAKQTQWVDSAYVGGLKAEYYLIVNTVLNGNISETYSYSIPESLKITYSNEDSVAHLTWEKPLFEKALKEYQIIDYSTNTIIPISNVQDTVFALKLNNITFEKEITIGLSLIPQNSTYQTFSTSSTIKNPLGVKKIRGIPVKYNFNLNSTFSLVGSELLLYNSMLEPIDSVNVGTYPNYGFLPVNGVFTYFYESKKVVQVNIDTKERNELRIDTIKNYRSGPYQITGTTNELVSYSYITTSGSYQYNYHDNIYDFGTKSILYSAGRRTTSISSSYSNPKLSEDGNYALFETQRNLYRIQNGALQLIGAIPVTGTFWNFRSDNNDEFFLTTSSKLDIYRSDDLSLVKSISFPSGSSLLNYDPVTHYLTFTSVNDVMSFINIDTDETKTFKAKSGIIYILLNGVLFNVNTGDYIHPF